MKDKETFNVRLCAFSRKAFKWDLIDLPHCLPSHRSYRNDLSIGRTLFVNIYIKTIWNPEAW